MNPPTPPAQPTTNSSSSILSDLLASQTNVSNDSIPYYLRTDMKHHRQSKKRSNHHRRTKIQQEVQHQLQQQFPNLFEPQTTSPTTTTPSSNFFTTNHPYANHSSSNSTASTSSATNSTNTSSVLEQLFQQQPNNFYYNSKGQENTSFPSVDKIKYQLFGRIYHSQYGNHTTSTTTTTTSPNNNNNTNMYALSPTVNELIQKYEILRSNNSNSNLNLQNLLQHNQKWLASPNAMQTDTNNNNNMDNLSIYSSHSNQSSDSLSSNFTSFSARSLGSLNSPRMTNSPRIIGNPTITANASIVPPTTTTTTATTPMIQTHSMNLEQQQYLLFESVFRYSPIPMAIISTCGKIEFVNHLFVQLLGCKSEIEVRNHNFHEFLFNCEQQTLFDEQLMSKLVLLNNNTCSTLPTHTNHNSMQQPISIQLPILLKHQQMIMMIHCDASISIIQPYSQQLPSNSTPIPLQQHYFVCTVLHHHPM